MKTYVDTSVLLAPLVDPPVRARAAIDALRSVVEFEKRTPVLSPLVVAELVQKLELKAKVPRALRPARVAEILSGYVWPYSMVAVPSGVADDLVRQRLLKQQESFDALHFLTAAASGCDELLTFDRQYASVVHGVRVRLLH